MWSAYSNRFSDPGLIPETIFGGEKKDLGGGAAQLPDLLSFFLAQTFAASDRRGRYLVSCSLAHWAAISPTVRQLRVSISSSRSFSSVMVVIESFDPPLTSQP